jgi:hypothetical protein
MSNFNNKKLLVEKINENLYIKKEMCKLMIKKHI